MIRCLYLIIKRLKSCLLTQPELKPLLFSFLGFKGAKYWNKFGDHRKLMLKYPGLHSGRDHHYSSCHLSRPTKVHECHPPLTWNYIFFRSPNIIRTCVIVGDGFKSQYLDSTQLPRPNKEAQTLPHLCCILCLFCCGLWLFLWVLLV